MFSGTNGHHSKRRLLIVDDEEAMTFALRDFFTTEGYEVRCAHEKEEAEALVLYHGFAVMIADLRLTTAHGHEGLDLVSSVRQRSPETRIVMLTAYGSPAIEVEARRRGVDAFLHKPRPLRELGTLVADLCRERT